MKTSAAFILAFAALASATPSAPEGALLLKAVKHQKYPDITSFTKRSGSVQGSLSNQVYSYAITLGLGNPVQEYTFLADTGSSELWIGGSTAITKSPYNYNADTARVLSDETQTLDYESGQVEISWATTDASFNGVQISNFPFGIANSGIQISDSGILGLAYTQYGKTNLPQMLKDQGVINTNAYSISLNDDEEENGSILFGAVDLAKCDGELLTVPRVDLPGTTDKYLAATLTAVSFDGYENTQAFAAPLDSGTSYTYLPDTIFNSIASYVGVDLEKMASVGGPIIDLSTNGDKLITLSWNGANITVTAKDISIPLNDGSDSAVFGIFPSSMSENTPIIGANFLRNMYTVFNLDSSEISLCHINTSDNTTPDIQIINNGVVPGARSATSA